MDADVDGQRMFARGMLEAGDEGGGSGGAAEGEGFSGGGGDVI